MTEKPVLYGFSGSTFVRTVRMVLADKAIAYDQVPVNVLTGEPKEAEHRARHPFGKVPVLDIDGMRLLETEAITRYLDDAYPAPALVPKDPKDRARMSMAFSVTSSYGYPALLGAAGYHLFPEFLGNPSEADYAEAMAGGETLLALLMEKKGDDPWLAGASASLADYLLAPIVFYVSLSPAAETLLAPSPVAAWWERMQGVPSFAATAPDLG
ncbi:MAG: glutathione S-transferase family protein [Pseudomonadota bacterium]